MKDQFSADRQISPKGDGLLERLSRRSFSISAAYERYEFEKLQFIRHNPSASPQEYEAAMLAIARKYGF